ncbi:hypothetical protein [Ponticaulis sp.]|uniref:hypothetical protein n=1 Tax=Ponticaulis sp. TaxID=2020902 RepID=UPI0026163A48|nr:hypothetical protein [Ponticaulis sp.]MDF1679671.1 hypothetical protein [Ponticaulis sp.]
MRAAKPVLLFVASAFAAHPAPAQDALDVPVTFEILNPGDLVSMRVDSEGDLGQIARSATTTCLYEHRVNTLYVEDFNTGEVVTAPGTTSSGCAQYGDVRVPTIELTCPGGMTLPIRVGIDYPASGMSFSARAIFFGERIAGTARGDDGYDFVLTCPTGRELDYEYFMNLEVYGLIEGEQNDIPSGSYDVAIPITFQFE